MESNTKSYTLRMPIVVLSRLEAYSRKNGMTQAQAVIQACREFLDPAKPYMIERRSVADQVHDLSAPVILEHLDDAADVRRKLQCAINSLSPSHEIPICGKAWWEDGEQYECLMDAGHREAKHGMRGMVRRLDA